MAEGDPPSISSKSALLLFLIFLKHGVTVECLKTMTGLSPTVIKSTITKMILLGRRVASILIRFPSPIEIMKLQDFQDFPDCKFVVDASHVRIERPKDQRAQREFYSGRHRFHEGKLQTLNTSGGEAVHVAGEGDHARQEAFWQDRWGPAEEAGRDMLQSACRFRVPRDPEDDAKGRYFLQKDTRGPS